MSGEARVDGRALVACSTLIETVRDDLRSGGVGPDSVVILTDLSVSDLLIGMVATWLLDAVPFVTPHGGKLPSTLRDKCQLRGGLEISPAGSRGVVPGLERTAVLMPTSGSTGVPKVARRGVSSVRAEANGYREYLRLTFEDRVAVPVPVTHSYGMGVTISALLAGCDVDTTPPTRLPTVAGRMDSGAVSVVALTAPIARLLVEAKRDGDKTVRAALVGAGSVPDELDRAFLERFRRPLDRGYGSTETGGTFLGARGIGRPIAGVGVRSPAPGGRGELVLKLAAPVEGALEGGVPVDVWHTGDIVERDTDGTCRFVDRIQEALRVNGRYVDQDEIVPGLRAMARVTDVHLVVLNREKTPEAQDIHAVVEAGKKIDESVLRKYISALRPGVPRPRITQCSRIPRNAVGKIDREALIGLIREEESSKTAREAPGNRNSGR
ncbi:AMP-binding protein [Amycolatopsis sp. WAC 04169]|uniref:AMP-binding protein n=1 Tax=Amycolatopsis sp. WAC 04169 TaxID=2203197 RepID=UPI00131588C1|nr:AMP-binding protein [Amycolatopsis sp. WAC 04169]